MKLGPFVLALAALFATPVQAGWVSGGGELVKNKNNPWFIQNTTTVAYCIERDATTFRMSEDRLDELIGKALDYWRDEFRRARLWSPIGLEMKLLTQTYVRQSCAESVDLRFQFGVLSPDQRRGIGIDPKEHVAFTIRTDYDERNLKARGFLYVTPDNGPERYRGEEYRDGVWHEADNRYLFEILVHELGHTLGMPHFGRWIMAEEYGEWLVRYPRLYPREGEPEIGALGFNFEYPRTRCKWDANSNHERAQLIDFLSLPPNFECVRVNFIFDVEEFMVKAIDLTYSIGADWHPIGRVAVNSWGSSSVPNIRLKFRAEQAVFPVDGPGSASAVPSNVDVLKGWLTPASGQGKKYLTFDFDPETFTMNGFFPERGLRSLMWWARGYDSLN